VNLILEKSDRISYSTNISEVFSALGISADAFDWYVSNIETDYSVDEFSDGARWISGSDLAQLLQAHEIQFVWGVFSAVRSGERPPIDIEPYVDGNHSYWSGKEIRPQLPGTQFEIACWDSSATILVGLSPDLEAAFRRTFPEARPLAQCCISS
jgi:hypothetical protein